MEELSDPRKEHELFRLFDEASYTGDYAEPFQYMQQEGIDPVDGVISYLEQNIEVAKSALEAEYGKTEHLVFRDIEKKGGLLRLKRAEKVANDVAGIGPSELGEERELKEEIVALETAYENMTNI